MLSMELLWEMKKVISFISHNVGRVALTMPANDSGFAQVWNLKSVC